MFQSVAIALVSVFTVGAFVGGAAYKALQGPGAEYVKRVSESDQRELRKLVYWVQVEAKNKARKGR